MKTLRQALLLMGLAIALAAPASQPDDAVITSIRNEYNQAQQTIKLNKKSKKGKNDMVTTMRYAVPGSGQANETLQFFFNLEQFGPVGEFVYYQLFFVTRQLKLNGRKYYEEYLYDKTGRLVFALKQDYDDNGKKFDKRFYYRDGSIYQVVGGPTGVYEEETTYYLAEDYRHAFDNLIRNAKE